MDPNRFGRVKKIFTHALDLDPEQRPAYLDQACLGDLELRRSVEKLLEHESDTGSFLESPAISPPLPPPDDEELIGCRIGQYQLIGVIDSGGMGTVFEALQDNPRRSVALKVMKQGLHTDEARQRFIYESRILARLEHPGIARVFDAGSFDVRYLHEESGDKTEQMETGQQIPYFAMEFIQQARLITAHAREQRLTSPERLSLFLQVCEAVHHGHQRGIIHRDLKPANILVDTSGRVKIIDFGVARATDSDIARTTILTEVGQLIGTIQYMSPEQCLAEPESLDIRSDVYSLGLVLYELLCETLPYDVRQASLVTAVRTIRETTPTPPSKIVPSLGGDLETIVLKAMEKEPAFRYQNVAELGEDIRRHLAGEPVLARPVGNLRRLGKWVKRNRALSVTLAGAMLIVTCFFCYVLLWSYPRIKMEKERMDQAYARVLRLSDVKRLANLEAEESTLWPAMPEQIPALESWITRAEALIDRVPGHLLALETMRSSAQSAADQKSEARHAAENEKGGGSGRTWIFNDLSAQWEHDTLVELLTRLEALGQTEKGMLAKVKHRLEFARTIEARSIEMYREEWDRVIAAIADRTESPAFDGLLLEEQLGLIPFGRDPDSGLWEFGHLQTGAPAVRGPDGRLRLTGETGLIFVLLPGGTFTMGADPPSADRPLGSPNVDPWCKPEDGPARAVTVAPFFISKYEMTQGQWLFFTGENPSYYDADGPERYKTRWNRNGDPHSYLLPVDQVSGNDCRRIFQQLDLRLPTEAEWEYAARAGTGTIWWTGNRKETLRGTCNIRDQFFRHHSGVHALNPETWLDDGHVVSAPVGCYRANPFGLHDVHGNVKEVCLIGSDPGSGASADGVEEKMTVEPRMVARGGGWISGIMTSRSASRRVRDADHSTKELGVRPAMSIRGMKATLLTDGSGNQRGTAAPKEHD